MKRWSTRTTRRIRMIVAPMTIRRWWRHPRLARRVTQSEVRRHLASCEEPFARRQPPHRPHRFRRARARAPLRRTGQARRRRVIASATNSSNGSSTGRRDTRSSTGRPDTTRHTEAQGNGTFRHGPVPANTARRHLDVLRRSALDHAQPTNAGERSVLGHQVDAKPDGGGCDPPIRLVDLLAE